MLAMSIFFHPHVACSYTFFLSGMVRVFVSCCIMAVIAFVFVVVVFFHPYEAGCFTVCFVFDVVVGVVVHVVTDAVFITVFVTVFVTVFISMVVMCVSTKHLENSHCEVFWVVCIKFDDVFAFFKVEDGNHCVSRASNGVENRFFCFSVVVAFVTIIVAVMFIVTFF